MQQPSVRGSSGGRSGANRRKVRKGTHSCWECRRRKTRCQFASATATVCVGCASRRTACVSQEFPEEKPPTSERGLSQRLSRVEGLLERLVERTVANSYAPSQTGEEPFTSSASAEDEPDSSSDITRPLTAGCLPVTNIFDPSREGNGSYTSAHTSFVPTPSPARVVVPTLPAKYARISETLYATFPPQRDIDAILAAGSGAYFLVTVFNGIDGLSDPPSSVSEVPPATSHPALLAKRLMQLTYCIQIISSKGLPRGLASREAARAQISRFVNVVSDLVASNDDLVGSVEGLETLYLVALYHGNAGSLRKAWLSVRRALSAAQLMGTDKWPDDKPLKSVDPQSDPSTRTRASSLWHRINSSDRYLSLLLGLPAGSNDDSFADPERTAHNTPTEKLGKLHTAVTGAIIGRKARGGNKQAAFSADVTLETTQAIDRKLDLAAKSISAEWWQPSNIDTRAASPQDVVRAHGHVTMLMNHHHLLILLHLPYFIRDAKERRWEHSRTTCLRASRELLRAYLVFRHLTDAASACRHTDYAALTAALTLLLGYLDPKLRARDVETACRRNEDRDLVVAVRDTIRGIAERDGDKLSRETSDIITRLLPLTDVNLRAAGPGDLGTLVRLEIPFLGTININLVSGRSQSQPQPQQQQLQQNSSNTTSAPASYDDGPAYTVPDDTLTEPSPRQPPQAATSVSMLPEEDANSTSMQLDPGTSPIHQLLELVAEVDEWTFQGFDATFFESLLS